MKWVIQWDHEDRLTSFELMQNTCLALKREFPSISVRETLPTRAPDQPGLPDKYNRTTKVLVKYIFKT